MINASEYQAIIFDLGGVVLNIDYHRPVEYFKALGAKNFDLFYSKKSQTTLFDDLETGAIDQASFFNALRKALSLQNTTDKDLENAWNSILLDLPKERLDILKALKTKTKLFLFSNTNAIHHKAFTESVQKQHHAALDTFFDTAYYSHLIHMRKPHPEGFKFILDQNKLTANKVLFLDDSVGHLKGAQALGIQTYHIENTDICDVLY